LIDLERMRRFSRSFQSKNETGKNEKRLRVRAFLEKALKFDILLKPRPSKVNIRASIIKT
jgi:hypothetical protein